MKYPFLRSRGWHIARDGWHKRGWCFQNPLAAEALENLMERTEGAVPPKHTVSEARLLEIEEIIQRAVTALKPVVAS